MLLLGVVASSAEAARTSRGLASLSIGYRVEANYMDGGLTGSISGDGQFYKGITVFGVVDLHRMQTGRSWDGSRIMSIGVGGWVGFKLRASPRHPGVKLSPGVAVGVLAFPLGIAGEGQHGTVRLSVDLAFVPEVGAGFILEFSSIHFLSDVKGWNNTRRSLNPIISLRLGMIIRSF